MLLEFFWIFWILFNLLDWFVILDFLKSFGFFWILLESFGFFRNLLKSFKIFGNLFEFLRSLVGLGLGSSSELLSSSWSILGALGLESISSLVFWVLISKYGGNLISTGSFINFLRYLSKMLFLEKNERNGAKVLKDWPCALVLLSVLFLWSWFTYFCQCRKSLGSFYVSFFLVSLLTFWTAYLTH